MLISKLIIALGSRTVTLVLAYFKVLYLKIAKPTLTTACEVSRVSTLGGFGLVQADSKFVIFHIFIVFQCVTLDWCLNVLGVSERAFLS